MTVKELLGRITSAELSEWMVYNKLEPFGENIADIRSGMIASTIANCNRGKNQKPFKVDDFIIKRVGNEKTEVEKMQEIKAGFEALMR